MPLSSPKRKVSDAENKLRVLCCLDALGMATQEQLWPFVARLELMEYIPFCIFLGELRSSGAIAAGSHALEGALYLTSGGKQQLELFSNKLVHADKERIREAARSYREELSARKLVRAAYELSQDGLCCAALTMREGDVPTLFIRVCTKDSLLTEKAVRGFQACAPQVLNLLYTLDLSGEGTPAPKPLPQEAAIAAAQPGAPSLCAFGGREHAAVVSISDDMVFYTVLLLLPSDELAWSWAQAADARSHELAAALTALFAASGDAV